MFNAYDSHLWARNNRRAIHECGCQVHFSVSDWAVIVGDVIIGPYLLPDRLSAQRCRDFLDTVLPGLLEVVPLAVRKSLWFQHDRAPVHYEKDVRQWLNATFFVVGSNSDGFFLLRTPEGARLCGPSKEYRRSHGKISRTCDNGRCQHVQACSKECRAEHCRLP
jgi:hypothetical protein